MKPSSRITSYRRATNSCYLISLRAMAIITQTPRIIVREYLPDEEALYLELLSDPLVTDYLPKRNNDENSKIFQDTLADYKKGVKLARWGVFDVANGDFIGF